MVKELRKYICIVGMLPISLGSLFESQTHHQCCCCVKLTGECWWTQAQVCAWLVQHLGSSWALEVPNAICRIIVTVTRGFGLDTVWLLQKGVSEVGTEAVCCSKTGYFLVWRGGVWEGKRSVWSEHNYSNCQQWSDGKRIVKLHFCSLQTLPELHMRSGSQQLVLAQTRGGIPLLVGVPWEPSPLPSRFLLPRLCSEQLRREWSSTAGSCRRGEAVGARLWSAPLAASVEAGGCSRPTNIRNCILWEGSFLLLL